ncbi:MAG: VPLPA-CTERM sorting domain-containing protein [Marinicaulis sp.]|nr:VPLPA-CTERM sorting domain-containing protein [Marinicaulis sp.]
MAGLFKKFAAIAAVSFASIGAAHAIVVSGEITGGTAVDAGGEFIILGLPFDPPNGPLNTVGNDTFQTPNVYAFNEDQNIEIMSDVVTDIGDDAMAGDTVASHYIFFDPGPNTTVVARITFDSEIFGVMTSTGLLGDSDFLANSGVTYLNPGLRGLETGDGVVLIDDFTIEIEWFAGTPGDYIRVLTAFSPGAEIPIPGAIPLFMTGLAGVGWLRRRKKA